MAVLNAFACATVAKQRVRNGKQMFQCVQQKQESKYCEQKSDMERRVPQNSNDKRPTFMKHRIR